MLSNLHIENIAVIPEADVSFSSGFTVLTGETGAGKSILIDAIHAVLGERTSRDLIRNGADKARVSAIFTELDGAVIDKLTELGYSLDEDNALLVTRTISVDGKNTARINGKPALASILKEISPMLVNIHGQHDSQALLYQENHCTYLDLLADNEKLLSDYRCAFTEMQKIRSTLKKAIDDEDAKSNRADMLRYQIDEIDKANIVIGQMEMLKNQRSILQNSEQIASLLSASQKALFGEDDFQGAVSLSEQALQNLADTEKYTNEYENLQERLAGVSAELSEVNSEIASALQAVEFDPQRLQEIEDRLDVLHSLCRKYGGSEEAICLYLDKAKEELTGIESADELLLEQQDELSKKVELVKQLGAKLTDSRNKAASKFAKQVEEQLKFLNMPSVKFVVDVADCKYSNCGANRVEFMISTNPGEPPKPMVKIASGGELSRIMLAIKNVLAAKDSVDTLIFDEIDTGISGNAAHKVGLKLRQTAQGKQVICVTHLAQIAALADTHLLIEKNISKSHATTTILPLDFDGRKRELSRIMSATVTDATLKTAEEMLLAVDKN